MDVKLRSETCVPMKVIQCDSLFKAVHRDAFFKEPIFLIKFQLTFYQKNWKFWNL